MAYVTVQVADFASALMAAYSDIENDRSSIGQVRYEADALCSHRFNVGSKHLRGELLRMAQLIEARVKQWPVSDAIGFIGSASGFESQFYQHAIRLRFVHEQTDAELTDSLVEWLEVTHGLSS